MEGVVNILRGLALSHTHARWTSHFTKLVKQAEKICTGPQKLKGAASSLEGILNQLEPYVLREAFSNTKEEEIIKAKEDLLTFWAVLLKVILDSSYSPNQTKAFSLIVAIMQRKEFSLKTLGFKSLPFKPDCSEATLNLQKQYHNMLVDTFILVMDSVSLKKENLVQTVQFCSNVLAIFFFRLPSVGASLICSLNTKKRKMSDNLKQFEKHKRRSLASVMKARSKITNIKRLLLNDGKEMISAEEATSVGSDSPSFTGLAPELQLHPLFLGPSKENQERGDDSAPVAPRSADEKPKTAAQLILSPRSKSLTSSIKRRFTRKRSKTKTWSEMCQESDGKQCFVENNPDLFHWSYFSTPANDASVKLENYLKSNECDCLKWLEEKDTFFITFLDAFLKHVVNTCDRTVEWSLISGYDLLLECFWPFFKSYLIWYGSAEKQVERAIGFVRSGVAANYVETASKLIVQTNPTVLNEIMYLIYCESNLFSIPSVEMSMDHLKSFLFAVSSANNDIKTGSEILYKNRLQESFNMEIYWFGIKSFMEQEHVQILRKVCVHLYECVDLFEGKDRKKLLTYILRDFFFKMFLHWSTEIRLLFQGLLVFKFFKTDRRKLPLLTDAELFEYSSYYIPQVQQQKDKKLICTPTSGKTIRGESKDAFEEGCTMDTTHMNDDVCTDIAVCSKVDYYITLCLEKNSIIPRCSVAYIDPALKSYAAILEKLYRGEIADNTQQISRLLLSMLQNEKLSVAKAD